MGRILYIDYMWQVFVPVFLLQTKQTALTELIG